MYCDNKSAFQIAHNSVFHERVKHTEINWHHTHHHFQHKSHTHFRVFDFWLVNSKYFLQPCDEFVERCYKLLMQLLYWNYIFSFHIFIYLVIIYLIYLVRIKLRSSRPYHTSWHSSWPTRLGTLMKASSTIFPKTVLRSTDGKKGLRINGDSIIPVHESKLQTTQFSRPRRILRKGTIYKGSLIDKPLLVDNHCQQHDKNHYRIQ